MTSHDAEGNVREVQKGESPSPRMIPSSSCTRPWWGRRTTSSRSQRMKMDQLRKLAQEAQKLPLEAATANDRAHWRQPARR